MPDYLTVSRTKDYFQGQLLRDHPEIVSIAPQLKLDAQGCPTSEAVIVIGVKVRHPPRMGGVVAVSPQAAIPARLPVVDMQGKLLANEYVEVVIEEEGDIVPHLNVARMRPCPGGFSVGPTRVTAGTLGGNVRFGSSFGFVLSNNHVLAAVNTGVVGDAILQPGVADGGHPAADTLAHLQRWVPIDLAGGNNEVDCAIAQAVHPAEVVRHVQGIGTPAAQTNATVGQAIRKSGRTTQLTTGILLSDNATLRVTYGPGQVGIFVNQLKYSQMAHAGDSGSLIWDQHSLTVVGLHMAASGSSNYGNRILRVLELLSQANSVFDAKGMVTHFPKMDLSLLDPP